MGLIKPSLIGFACMSLVIACAPKKKGANTHAWTVTAQNGDKAVGCLAEDVTSNLSGYINIEALPNLNIATFESLGVSLEESEQTGKYRSGLVDMSKGGGVGTWNREDYVKHCDAYPPAQSSKEWYFFQVTDGEQTAAYRLFSLGKKVVFIDARTEDDSD